MAKWRNSLPGTVLHDKITEKLMLLISHCLSIWNVFFKSIETCSRAYRFAGKNLGDVKDLFLFSSIFAAWCFLLSLKLLGEDKVQWLVPPTILYSSRRLTGIVFRLFLRKFTQNVAHENDFMFHQHACFDCIFYCSTWDNCVAVTYQVFVHTQDGFSLSGGSNRKCRRNGLWSGKTASCRASVCPELQTPENGRKRWRVKSKSRLWRHHERCYSVACLVAALRRKTCFVITVWAIGRENRMHFFLTAAFPRKYSRYLYKDMFAKSSDFSQKVDVGFY